jgi:protein gp37
MENTKIEWATHTFNPWIGCTKVSEGCDLCYAETEDGRRGWTEQGWGPGKPRYRTSPDNWRKPRQWNKAAAGAAERPRVFCASLADVFDREAPIEWLIDLLGLIDDCKNLDWLLLTKRPQLIIRRMQEAMHGNFEPLKTFAEHMTNVWLGVSAENQARWDQRVPELLAIPAAVHFVSAEPLLGPINLDTYYPDWIIAGGESGRTPRLMREDWAVSLRDQCTENGVAFHFKQWGGSDKKAAGRVMDGRTWDELPAPRVPEIA